jgi:hypothetical protein
MPLRFQRVFDLCLNMFAWGRRSGSAVQRWLGRWIDWILVGALVALGLWIAARRPFGLEPAPSGSLAGALFSGAAVLLANAINRASQRAQAVQEREERLRKLRRLITAELRNVAGGLLDAKRLLDAAIISLRAGAAALQAPDMRAYWPRALSLTTDLVTELLLLDESTIDALVTLQSNLAVTRVMMDEISGERFWYLKAEQLSSGIAHDLGVLATTFERIAPTAMLRLPGQDPAPAAEVLRRAAQPPRDPREPPAAVS